MAFDAENWMWQASKVMKTTVELDDVTHGDLRELAESQGLDESSVIREAVTFYLRAKKKPTPRGLGAYSSGRTDISERIEELLEDRVRPGG